MVSRILADLLLALHLFFILFAVCGSFLALRWPRVVWIHLPAAVWAALVTLLGGICPLTELENTLRHGAGMAGYPDGLVGSLLLPLIYPHGLTRPCKSGSVWPSYLLNGIGYGILFWRRRTARRCHDRIAIGLTVRTPSGIHQCFIFILNAFLEPAEGTGTGLTWQYEHFIRLTTVLAADRFWRMFHCRSNRANGSAS
jgi:hypothetical protein